ncbi:MAG TPA: hypothetical protein VF048_12555 [Gemmatimonadaceae bacterium]|jgi:hypothetical protein
MPARFRSWERWWAIAWAVLQFALPAAASYADAGIERSSTPPASHIESGTTADCPPVHSADCGVCQLLSHQNATAPATCALPVVASRIGVANATPLADPGDALRFDAPARAPPRA